MGRSQRRHRRGVRLVLRVPAQGVRHVRRRRVLSHVLGRVRGGHEVLPRRRAVPRGAPEHGGGDARAGHQPAGVLAGDADPHRGRGGCPSYAREVRIGVGQVRRVPRAVHVPRAAPASDGEALPASAGTRRVNRDAVHGHEGRFFSDRGREAPRGHHATHQGPRRSRLGA